jgi:transcriptional regulator with XRE-family HTH domain
MIGTRQIKAARALLGWSQEDLANRSGVSYPTIARLEAVDGPLGGRPETEAKIVRALVAAGAAFMGPGVALKLKSTGDRVSYGSGEVPPDLKLAPREIGVVCEAEKPPIERGGDGFPRIRVRFGDHETGWISQHSVQFEQLDATYVDRHVAQIIAGDEWGMFRRTHDTRHDASPVEQDNRPPLSQTRTGR